MAQSVKHLTLGFTSGHDHTFGEFEPRVGLSEADSIELAWNSLSPSLCSSLAHSLSLNLSLKISK